MTEIGLMPHVWLVPTIGLMLTLIGAAAIVFGRDNWGLNGFGVTGVFFAVFGVIGLFAGSLIAIPYDAKYWTYYEISGPLTEVSNRFENATGDNPTSGSYPARIGEQQVVMEDSRIFNYSIGDDVNLRCSVQWVYQGQDQLNCVIRSY
jgi:hypothetical protein